MPLDDALGRRVTCKEVGGQSEEGAAVNKVPVKQDLTPSKNCAG